MKTLKRILLWLLLIVVGLSGCSALASLDGEEALQTTDTVQIAQTEPSTSPTKAPQVKSTPATKPIEETVPEPATESATEPLTEPTEEAAEPETEAVVPQGQEYVLNTNTGKFHYPSCSSVGKMKTSNKSYYTGARDEVISMGYSPCQRCYP